MKERRSNASRGHWLLAAFLTAAGCGPAETSKSPPATVSAPNEQNLSTVTLSEDAYRRLDIAAGLTKVKAADQPRRRTLGGEAIVPPGRAARLAAPLAGVVSAPSDGLPKAGQKINEGAAIFQFTPLLSAEAKVNLATTALDAQQQVKSAQIQLQIADLALKRTRDLAGDKTVSEKVLEEAVASRDLAKQAVDAAVARQKLLERVLTESTAGKDTTFALQAPVAGVLQRMEVPPGAAVAAGAALFEVVQTDPLWVRVPVYAGAIHELKTGEEAEVRPLSAAPNELISATPVRDAPLVADPLAISVDLYYRIANPDGRIRPGEKVEVTIKVPAPANGLVVPWSAVVHDIHGGEWVYEQLADSERSFRRRRVEVQYVSGAEAVLASGPAVGTHVATGGAVELLGTEFGFGAHKK